MRGGKGTSLHGSNTTTVPVEHDRPEGAIARDISGGRSDSSLSVSVFSQFCRGGDLSCTWSGKHRPLIFNTQI